MTLEDLFPATLFALPEQVLWLAVIERALMDAVWPTTDLNTKDRHNLNWFFFSEEIEPFNLTFICETLFDYPDAAKVIRKRVIEMKKNPDLFDFNRSRRFRGYY